MPSTYTTNLGIEKIATGEQSGTWGTTTNTNLDLLDQAVNGVEQVTLSVAGSSGSPNDLPITNGSSSDGRNKFIEFVDGGDLGGTAYVQLTPNDAEKIVFIRNSLSAARNIIIFQGTYNASNDFEIPNGADVVLKFDGAGASATVTDVYVNLTPTKLTTANLVATSADINGGSVDGITLGTNSAVSSAVITTADINGGTIDGVTIGGASAGAGTFTTLQADTSLNVDGTVTADGLTVENDSLDIIVKDTQAYTATDGPLIQFQGKGPNSTNYNFGYIQGLSSGSNNAGDLVLGTNTSGVQYQRMRLEDNGDISFYEDTGATPKLFWDASAEALGINNTTPTRSLEVTGRYAFSAVNSNGSAQLDLLHIDGVSSSTNAADLVVGATYYGAGSWRANDTEAVKMSLHNDGKITFSTNSSLTSGSNFTPTERMRIDSSGNVGIGTSSPSSYDSAFNQLVVADASASAGITIATPTTTYGRIAFADGTTGNEQYRGSLTYNHSTDAMTLSTAATERMRIDSSGNVGIGTSSPNYKLETKDGDIAVVKLESAAGGNTVNGIRFRVNNSANTAQSATLGMVNAETVNAWGGVLTFSTKPANSTPNETVTERMRLDSSGNLLVGTTSTDIIDSSPADSSGVVLSADGTILASVNGAHYLTRRTTDGAIIVFRKDGTNVGQINSNSGNSIVIGSQDVGLRFFDYGNAIYPMDADSNSDRDNAIDLGTSSTRFKDLYLSGGVNNSTGLVSIGNTQSNGIDFLTSTASGQPRLRPSGDNTTDLGESAKRFKDLYLSGGVYLGGTGSANYLDDYEEGTWTPVYEAQYGAVSVTYTHNVGKFTRIGNIVHVQFSIRTNSFSAGTGSGSMYVGDLPFTVSSTANSGRSGGSVGYGADFVTNNPSMLRAQNGNDQLAIFYRTSANGNPVGLAVSDMSTSSSRNFIIGSCVYTI